MTNDIQKPGNPWLDYGNAAAARSFFGTLLKFSKGEFLAGMEDRLIPIGTEMVANMESLAVGWVRWKSNMPVEQRMGLVADGFIPVNRSDLGDADQSLWETNAEGRPRDPWQLTNHLIMFARDLEVFTFVTSSRGGLDAVGELSKTYGKQMHQRPNQFPLIELEVDSYPHRQKRFGRIKIRFSKSSAGRTRGLLSIRSAMTRRRPGRLHRTRRRRRRPSRRRPTRITTRAQSINRDRRWISLALISEFMVALQSSRSVMMPPAAHRRGRYSRHRQQSEGACGRCCATQPGRDPPPPPCADRECAGDAEARGELRFKYGREVGAIEATVAGCGIPLTILKPRVWKQFHRFRGDNKELSRQRALQLFPTAHFGLMWII